MYIKFRKTYVIYCKYSSPTSIQSLLPDPGFWISNSSPPLRMSVLTLPLHSLMGFSQY